MTDENKPPQDPETLMSIEPTEANIEAAETVAPRPGSIPGNTPKPTASRAGLTPRTGASPRIPSSQVQAPSSSSPGGARTTPQTMAEGPGNPITGGKIMVGTKLGQIEINGVLGKGGMGQVFRGYHAALDIEVAIKVLPDELSRNEVVRQRFLREARLCIKLDHQNIVRVFNVDEWQGNLYLVLELIEGADAAGMLKDGGRFRYKRALEIGKAAAEALAYAHTQGLVHRDVKPHNILLGAQDGKIKLSDFGLARAASSASHLTMSGQIMGTPHYMSPEQAESKEVTDKSDVYSLGVTLYHMLTGETPFVGDTPISVAVQHIAKEILYPEMRFSAFPKELVAVLKRMTAKDPAKRCGAKQAAVWLQKLWSMATDDDISAEPTAMRSLAPVVAESEAFRLAAERRKANDERAREEAKSMVMMVKTMAEAQAVIDKTMAEQQKAPEPQPGFQASGAAAQPQPSGGMGKLLVAALMLIVLGGGGFAAWYFTMGPGANKTPLNNTSVIGRDGNTSDGVRDGRSDGKTDGKSDAKADGTKTDGRTDGKSDGTTDGKSDGKTDGSPTDGKTDGKADGKTDGTSDGRTDGTSDGRTDGRTDGSTDGGPPPEQDNPVIEGKLVAAEKAVSDAKTTQELKQVKRDIDLLRLEMGKGSKRQRDAFATLEQAYLARYAYCRATEQLDVMEAALDAFKADKEADAQLNTALEAMENISKLSIPAEVAAQLKDRKDDLFRRAEEALTARHDLLRDKAEAEAAKNEFSAADKFFEMLLNLRLDSKRKADAQLRRETVFLEGRIFGTYALINGKNFKEAKTRVAADKARKIPDALKERFAKLEADLEAAIEKDLNEFLAAARSAADKAEFKSAKAAVESGGDLPLNDAQLIRLDEARYYVSLCEPIVLALNALEVPDYPEAAKQIAAADAVISAAKERKTPEVLASKLADARARLVSGVNTRFADLMAAAKVHVDRQEFAEAGKCIDDADHLPLSEDQRKQLDAFKSENSQKLKEYVQGLLTEVEKALTDGDFEKAQLAFDKAKRMPIAPEDLQRLEKLKLQFGEEAARRFLALLDSAQKALGSGKYAEALDLVAKMKKLPVPPTLMEKADALDKQIGEDLTKAVTAKLQAADELSKEKKDYKAAKALIDEATQLAVTEELKKKCRNAQNELDRDINDAFETYLEKAKTARKANEFAVSEKALKDAQALPLNQEQLVTLGRAVDQHKADRDTYVNGLFKDLEGAVAKGDEAAGEAIAKKLSDFNLTVSEQVKLKRLRESLSGESRERRIERMPAHLKKLATDRYLQSEQVFNVTDGASIEAVAASPDGRVGACGTRSGDVYFYNLRRGTLIGQTKGGNRLIKSLAVSPDGKWGACGNDDGYVVLFDLSGPTVLPFNLPQQDDDITGLGFSKDNRVLFVLLMDGNLVRVNVAGKNVLAPMKTGIRKPSALAVDASGSLLAVGGGSGEIQVFDANSLLAKRDNPLKCVNSDPVQRLCFSLDGRLLIAGSIAENMGVWDTAKWTEKPMVQLKGLDEWARGVGFSADGKRACGFDSEKRFVIWDARTGLENKRYEFDTIKRQKRFDPRSGYIGPDGTLLLGTADGELIHLTVKPAS